MTLCALKIENLAVQLQKKTILDAFSLTLNEGDILCLLGPSGCGKTTLLRTIAGLQSITQGDIQLGSQIVSSTNTHLATESRQVGMVFQDYALFPHLNIADNIRFGIKNFSKQQQQERIRTLLELIDLTGKEKRYPHEL